MNRVDKSEQRVALVTGATTGIGEAIAHALAGIGMTVVVTGRRQELLDAVAKKVNDSGALALAISCDINDTSAIERLFTRIGEELGRLDVLINSAGIGYKSEITDFATEDFREALGVNVLGAAVFIREAIKLLAHRPGTAIIAISSMAAHRVPPGGFGLYAATKYALRALMESLRSELVALKSPTKIASISPGTVATDFHKRFARTEVDPTEALPFERLLPSDVADAVLYVLSTAEHVQVNELLIRPIGQGG